MSLSIEKYLEQNKKIIDKALKRFLPSRDTYPAFFHQAIRYVLFPGGKRLRPILSIAACQTMGGRVDWVIPAACALELIHTSSLVHDDLPSMDNDDLRRGKPSCHKEYGEAVAILTGDTLLPFAFELIAKSSQFQEIDVKKIQLLIQRIANVCGSRGMAGAQIVDLGYENKKDKKTLNYIYSYKTAALIEVSVWAGGLLGGASQKELMALSLYGQKIGFAYQIIDDLLDLKEDKSKKFTYPSIYGIKQSKQKAKELNKQSKSSLKMFGKKADTLKGIADFIIDRKY